MALSHEQQAIELITRAKRILIATKEHAPVDALSSIVALSAFLKKLNKESDAVAPGFDAAKAPAFLPTAKQVHPVIGAMRAFQLNLDVSTVPLSELMYEVKNGKLEITIVPKTGEWSPKDISFKHGEDRYDLVIALDCPDMAALGPLFREHADFLYRTTIVNIDRDPGNEHWGQVNLVDLTAVSTSEVLFGMFERWNRHLLDEEIATALLAGMIAKTNSFRNENVTPKTLQISSQLISMGAKREDIVHGLWRTRTVPTLKLWGRALSRLEQDREHGLVWTTLARQDFLDAGAVETALDGIVDELVGYAPEAKVVVLVYETEHAAKTGACVSIHVTPPYSAQELGRTFGATGSRDKVEFCLAPGASLVEGVKTVIERLRGTLKATKT
jgi:nanoRNase/pAp phosphatase (c-di-AMP/oligoRNAs hydrolase)